MSRLNAASRSALSVRDFAEPGKRAYPIEDRSHARDALSRVAADGTPHEKAVVRHAVKVRYPDMKVSG